MSNILVSPIDLHKALRRKEVEVSSNVLDLGTTLPIRSVNTDVIKQASEAYQISPNIEDYIINTILQFPINVPNRNNLAFEKDNLQEWSWEYSCPWYKTWIAQPAFYEHKNNDCTKANGIILDVAMIKDPRGFWKQLALIAHDRTKYHDLIARVAAGELNTYSMGAYITGGYICSITGRDYKQSPYLSGSGKKKGLEPKIVVKDGKEYLAYRIGLNPKGFETSLVEEPAWSIASSETLVDNAANLTYF